MYDSTAKDVQGYLSGSRYELGDFDECIYTETHAGDLAEPLFTGQYCLAEINHYNVMESFSGLSTKMLAARPYKVNYYNKFCINFHENYYNFVKYVCVCLLTLSEKM